MSKTLVIVESPAKAKTIGRYLGKEYRIAASVGHIRDLPSAVLGVDVNNQYKPRYINMSGKDKVIRELKDLAGQADRVLIATDPDREGEAIAWHLAKILSIDEREPCRITFNEITESAVKSAVDQPQPIDMDLVNAQQARRILDRLVGYELSPLLWKKVRKGLSAGRVQSVATRLIVQREREIDAFKPVEYWLLMAWLKKTGQTAVFRARFAGIRKGDKVVRQNLAGKDESDAVLRELEGKTYTVWQVRKATRQRSPGPPFTTSTLQQDAGRGLGFTARRTMAVAQQLYEGIEMSGSGATSLVTYIRTDSVRVSEEATREARQLIKSQFGDAYLPRSVRHFKNRSAAQDAHEAIRPAHFDLPPDKVRHQLSPEQYRLYKLIWDRFIASQMAAAQIDTVNVDIQAGAYIFRAQGETVRFDGFLAQYRPAADGTPDDASSGHARGQADTEGDDAADEMERRGRDTLPDLNVGEILVLNKLTSEQKFTQPPPRYTEATLIKAMEEQGIGRPSTYAPTLSTIQDRQYVEKKQKYLHPTELGKVVTGLLEQHFEQIVDVAFTANMEAELDTVEGGQSDWVSLLDRFYPPFHQQILDAGQADKVEMAEEKTGETCPQCQSGELVIKQGRYGRFIACTRYPDCTYTRNLEEAAAGKCPLCGSGLVSRISKKFKGSRFYTCDKRGSNPECPFISWDLPIEGRNCPECGTYMVLRRFRGRSYLRCGNRDCPTNARRKQASADDAVQA